METVALINAQAQAEQAAKLIGKVYSARIEPGKTPDWRLIAQARECLQAALNEIKTA